MWAIRVGTRSLWRGGVGPVLLERGKRGRLYLIWSVQHLILGLWAGSCPLFLCVGCDDSTDKRANFTCRGCVGGRKGGVIYTNQVTVTEEATWDRCKTIVARCGAITSFSEWGLTVVLARARGLSSPFDKPTTFLGDLSQAGLRLRGQFVRPGYLGTRWSGGLGA